MSIFTKELQKLLSLATLLVLSVSINTNVLAQIGPAGVGNNTGTNGQPKLEMWYEAAALGLTNNDLISSVNDLSGNGYDLSQSGSARPTFKNAADANYNFASIRFDGTDDFIPFNGELLVNTDYTVIAVAARRSNGRNVFFGGSVGGNNQNFHPYFNTNALHSHQWGNDHNAAYTGGAGSTVNATTPNFGVFSFRLNSSLATGQRAMFQNGTLIDTRDNGAQLSTFPGATLGYVEAIGNDFSNLDLAEIIIFSSALTDAQIAIVSNYLSSKYDLAMDGSDYYAGDTPANGNFDSAVTGIGRLNAATVLENQSEGVLLFADASLDTDGEFVMLGTNNTANSVSTADLGAGVASRWLKTWYIDKTTAGTLGAEIAFDIQEGIGGEYPAGAIDNYVLLRRNGASYDIVPISAGNKSFFGSKVQFQIDDAGLIDGEYTLGTIDNANSPLDGQPNQTWYSRLSGDWDTPLTWTTDGSGSDQLPPGGGIPDATDNVVILSGRDVSITSDDKVVASMEVNGVLDVGASSGHNFVNIAGNGTVRLSGNAGVGNFPSGNTADFADDFIGGTVEYYGTGLTINEERLFNNVVVNLSGVSNELVLLNNIRVNGDLTISNGVFKVNDNTATEVLSLAVYGDTFINTNGSFLVGEGNTIGTYSIPGNMPTTGNYHKIYHQLSFYGDFNNNGIVRFTNETAPIYNQFSTNGAATVYFSGATNNVATLAGQTDFYNLVIDKGIDQTYEIEINATNTSNFGLFGPNNCGRQANGGFTAENPEVRKALWIYNGTLHLTGFVEIPTLSEGNSAGGNGDYPIGQNAGLWIDGSSVSVYTTADDAPEVPAGAVGINGGGSNQALSLYGRFRISDGHFGTRGSAGFIFWNAAAGEVLIEGGTVNVSQFRSAQAGTGTYTYTQSGGDVLVRANEGRDGETSGAYDLFSLDLEEAVFNMSGGTLTVYGNRSDAIFINSKPGNYSVTGGSVFVENRNGNNATIASTVPFWNLTLSRDQAGDAGEIDLISCTSGANTITDPNLVVLNDFVIKSGITFDHNGNDVAVGSDFTVELGANYVFDDLKPNTLTLNGVDNSKIALLNIAGGGAAGDVQRFYNLVINKPHGIVVSLESSKSGGNFNGFNNNLFRVDGEAFKLLSGTLDQGRHSILVNCDTLVNYDVLTLYNESLGTSGANNVDANFNGNNDQVKLASNQGGPTDITFITADTAIIGNLKFFMQNFVVDLNSDLTIQFLEHNNGRFNIQDNNLKVTYYNQNVSGLSARGLTNMIVTNGKASDGGFSLAVKGNGSYTFPIGIGLTGASPASKYTPATVTVTNFSDDGFITINPVDKVLATTDGSGGDILSYYWKVDYSEFTSLPTVQYQFRYYDNDDDGGSEANFVAGKVLEELPYTRNYEDDNIPENEGVNTSTNIITFNGPSDAGFTLENASYTAGEPGRFIGAPQIFYSRNSSPTNWTNGSAWSLTRDGGAAGDYPQDGDIAILTRDNGGAGDPTGYGAGVFTITNGIGAINIAKLIYDDFDPVNNNWISGCPRVTFDVSGGYNAYNSTFSTVEVSDRHIGGPVPNQSHGAVIQYNLNTSYPGTFPNGDFEDFNRYENALVIYQWDGGTGTVRLSDEASGYPMLWFQGGNSNNRIFQFPDIDVTVNGRANINGNMRIRVNDGASRTLTFKNILEIGSGCCNQGFFEFEGDATGNQTVIVEGDIVFNSSNGGAIRIVNNSSNNTHRLISKSNITVSNVGTLDLGNGSNSVVILELQGEGNHSFTNQGTANLYSLIVNKGISKLSTFSFDDNFSINAPTNGVTKAITISNGKLILNDPAINVDLTTGGPSFNIPATGGLQLTQGTANVSGDNSGILLDGCIIIDGPNGTLDMTGAGNGNNFIEYSASGSAQINISNGSLLVGSQIRRNLITTEGRLNYIQTGGTVVVGQNAAPEASRGVFEIVNTGSNFTYTGGTLTLVRQNTATPAVAALKLLPSNSNVTETIYIGNGLTPVSQTNFGINSNIPLAGLTVSGINSPTARLIVNDLTLTGELLINTGATFNANGIGLNLSADFTNNGTFTPSNNTTKFNSSGSQNIQGSGSTTFYNLIKEEAGTLDVLDNGITINNLFTFSDGILSDNGNTIDLKGNAILDGEHVSSGAGDGLKFSGSTAQQLLRSGSGSSTMGIVTISNPTGLVIPEGGGFNFTITDELRMNGGVFNIGSSAVTLGQNADVTTSSAFSVTNMVKTNSSFSDNGLAKIFSAGYNQTFTFPIGEEFYTPVVVDLSVGGGTSGSSVGSIAAKPANEHHPTVLSGGDVNNVLQYYWVLKSSGLNDFKGDIKLYYNQSDVSLTGANTEAGYIAARILNFNNTNNDINKFSADDLVDESTNELNFTNAIVFDGVSSNSIAGDYFAGIDAAIPDNVATYTSTGAGGSVVDDATFIESLPTPGTPPSGAVLVVTNGTVVDFDIPGVDVRLYKTIIEAGGILNVETSEQAHRLGILEGTGTLKITSDGSNAALPAADYGNFFSCTGGGLEYAGNGSYNVLPGISSVRNLTLSGSGSRNFPNNNVTICEDLVVDGPTLTNLNNRNITINNNLIINNGVYNSKGGILLVRNDMNVSGGTFNQNEVGLTNLGGDLNITSGVFNAGTGGVLQFFGDVSYSGGNYLTGIGNRTFIVGSSVQNISGEFTGTSKFYRLSISNASGVNLNGNIEVDYALDLSSGIITTNSNAVRFDQTSVAFPNQGRSNSYINGKATKEITSAGGNFTFPIGSATKWRPATVKNVSTAGLTWEAQFFAQNAIGNSIVTTDTPTNSSIKNIQIQEYWVVSDGATAPPGVTANVGLSWGQETDVSADPNKRQQLEVMVWNDGSDTWDNKGGGTFSGGNTQAQGSFVSTSAITFSENILSVGSSDEANPLPVELMSFEAISRTNSVDLFWSTATEKNNDFFEVQRSFDGSSFETIGVVEGSGTVLFQVDYDFVDNNPLNGKSYYRLKQNDYDGNFEYSEIISVSIEVTTNLRLFPNPTTDQEIFITLDGFHSQQAVEVKIFNLQGRSVFNEVLSPEDIYRKPLPVRQALNPGIYILEVNQGGTSKQVRLAIQ